jgi:hypothetical protein
MPIGEVKRHQFFSGLVPMKCSTIAGKSDGQELDLRRKPALWLK